MQHADYKPTPRHQYYGYGGLKAGEFVVVTPVGDDNIAKLRGHIHGHGNYHGKEFKTSRVGAESLRVERLK